jgi:hypothetical protein
MAPCYPCDRAAGGDLEAVLQRRYESMMDQAEDECWRLAKRQPTLVTRSGTLWSRARGRRFWSLRVRQAIPFPDGFGWGAGVALTPFFKPVVMFGGDAAQAYEICFDFCRSMISCERIRAFDDQGKPIWLETVLDQSQSWVNGG